MQYANYGHMYAMVLLRGLVSKKADLFVSDCEYVLADMDACVVLLKCVMLGIFVEVMHMHGVIVPECVYIHQN